MSLLDAQSPSTFNIARADVLGVGVHATNPFQAVDYLLSAVRNRTKGYVSVTGVHGVMEAQRDPTLRQILNNSLLVLPDGMPTVWIGRRQGHARMDRVFGPDFMWEFCRRSVSAGVRHFLYGGRPGVAQSLQGNMEKAFPGIQVVGTFTPPFAPLSRDEECALISQVKAAKPDVVWVGISTPKQERFMAEFVNKLDTTLLIGVGAAFDLHTGNMKDSPAWMKRSGLQWLHRLSQDPKRLWKRYLVNNTLFIYSVSMQALGVRKSPRI